MSKAISEAMVAALTRLQGGGIFEYNAALGRYYISRTNTVPGVNDWMAFTEQTISALRKRGYITAGPDAKITDAGREALGL